MSVLHNILGLGNLYLMYVGGSALLHVKQEAHAISEIVASRLPTVEAANIACNFRLNLSMRSILT